LQKHAPSPHKPDDSKVLSRQGKAVATKQNNETTTQSILQVCTSKQKEHSHVVGKCVAPKQTEK